MIQPRIPDDLWPVLREYEIQHTSDAILWNIEKHGYHISLDGPDITKTPDYRWTVRVYTNETDRYGYPVDRKRVHGPTALIALARAFAWISERKDQLT